ncbi:cell wall hydrolase [Sphingomonas carotinifaciens]|uniref:cell wall hydrolase n=2 Tax=Sphingomonadaceae TaxID=41297 RepID=UPI000DDBE12D|nr:cell wall hydrolase [Sphingomonas carotinifaciens]
MTVFKRVAAFATMTLAVAGLLGTSTPGQARPTHANGIAATGIGMLTPASFSINVSDLIPVPQTATAVQAATPDLSDAEADDYDTLAEAVAAQTASDDDEALRCLAGAIYFESKGEPLSGQLAVAQVVLNRARSGQFPSELCDVIKQRGQFGFVRGGEIPDINESRTAYRTAVAVAKVALAEAWDSEVGKALYFNTPDRRPAARLTRIASIGNHIFYR